MTTIPVAGEALTTACSTSTGIGTGRLPLAKAKSPAVREHGSGQRQVSKTDLRLRPGQVWMRSSAVACRLGIKTDTLKKWRAQGKGPSGWKRTSATAVMYTVTTVLQFEEKWHGVTRDGDESLLLGVGVGLAN